MFKTQKNSYSKPGAVIVTELAVDLTINDNDCSRHHNFDHGNFKAVFLSKQYQYSWGTVLQNREKTVKKKERGTEKVFKDKANV